MISKSTILRYISEEIAIGSNKNIQTGDDLLSAGILDSLGVLQLVAFVEEQFGIQIPDEDVVMENFQSIDALSSYLTQLTAQQQERSRVQNT
jgi:acyl carrier protein